MNRMAFKHRPLPDPPRGSHATAGPDAIDLASIAGALRRGRWLILGCIVVAGLIAVQVLRTSKPVYFSNVEILLDTRQERIVGVEQIVSDLNVSNSTVAGEVAVLQSNLLLGRVVDQLDLVNNPAFDPYLVEEPGVAARMVDGVKTQLAQFGLLQNVPEPMPDAAGDTSGTLSAQDARNLVIWQLRRNLSIFQSGISYVITVSMSAHDPALAARIANAVADQYIEDQLAGKLLATQRAIDWLDNRLVELEGALRTAEDAVVEFRALQIRDQGGNVQGVAQQLSQLNAAVVDARNERAAAEARLTQAQRLLNENGPEAAAAALNTPRLTSLDTEMADLERRRAQLATRMGPQHPDMLAVDLALNDLKRDRVAAIDTGIKELESALAQARARQNAVSDDIKGTLQRQLDLSRTSVRLSQLERSASATRQVYESFLNRFQETTQQLEFQRPDARIITEAQPPLSPARPRKKLIIVVALFLGGILGVATCFAKEAMDRSIRQPKQLERLTGTKVLASLPRLAAPGPLRNLLYRKRHQHDALIYDEGLRVLRYTLTNPASRRPPPKVVMLTGADWNVGCSVTAQGLAQVLSAIGQDVVIVESNFRRPKQAELWGVKDTDTTLNSYLAGDVDLAQVFARHVEKRVWVVTAARTTGNAADLLSGDRFRVLIEGLSAQFDTVILDAPPAMGVADTTILADVADAVVVVARSGRTRGDAVVSAMQLIGASGAPVLGTVLTDAEIRRKGLPVSAPQPPVAKQPAFAEGMTDA
ncbi:GumC family protein [Loktanella salsilacus]|uniref:GumC family protein n=1 Tax=Loktanella salsilacus TaxID=195913 RepID=UPI0037350CDF